MMVRQVLARDRHDDAWYWATHQGVEIDLVLRRGDRLLGLECKRTDAPGMTKSIRIAISDLGLEQVVVIYPGTQRYPLADDVTVVPLRDLGELSSGASIFDDAGGDL